MRSAAKIELIAFITATAAFGAAGALGDEVAIVPQYMAAFNLLLVAAALVIVTVLVHQGWIRLRWWSIPLDAIVLLLALSTTAPLLTDISQQVPFAPRESTPYRGGFSLCSTEVVGSARDPKSGGRRYTLQRSCFPDPAQAPVTFVQHGWSPLMWRVEAQLP